MIERRPELPDHMDGSLSNPLGARALYLFQGTKDTLFRIHGTNEPKSIGHAASSGCIRMENADVIDLYGRVSKGARVVVRSHPRRRNFPHYKDSGRGKIFAPSDGDLLAGSRFVCSAKDGACCASSWRADRKTPGRYRPEHGRTRCRPDEAMLDAMEQRHV